MQQETKEIKEIQDIKEIKENQVETKEIKENDLKQQPIQVDEDKDKDEDEDEDIKEYIIMGMHEIIIALFDEDKLKLNEKELIRVFKYIDMKDDCIDVNIRYGKLHFNIGKDKEFEASVTEILNWWVESEFEITCKYNEALLLEEKEQQQRLYANNDIIEEYEELKEKDNEVKEKLNQNEKLIEKDNKVMKKHLLKFIKGNPKEYNSNAFCDICSRSNLSADPFSVHCKECHFDLCIYCFRKTKNQNQLQENVEKNQEQKVNIIKKINEVIKKDMGDKQLLTFYDLMGIFGRFNMDDMCIDVNLRSAYQSLEKNDNDQISRKEFIEWWIDTPVLCPYNRKLLSKRSTDKSIALDKSKSENKEENKSHELLYLMSSPVEYEYVRCNECQRTGLERQGFFIHCDICSYDICLYCFRRGYQHKIQDNKDEIIIKLKKYMQERVSNTDNVDSILLTMQDIKEMWFTELKMDEVMIDVNMSYCRKQLIKNNEFIKFNLFINWWIKAPIYCNENQQIYKKTKNLDEEAHSQILISKDLSGRYFHIKCNECLRENIEEDPLYFYCDNCQQNLCIYCARRNYRDYNAKQIKCYIYSNNKSKNDNDEDKDKDKDKEKEKEKEKENKNQSNEIEMMIDEEQEESIEPEKKVEEKEVEEEKTKDIDKKTKIIESLKKKIISFEKKDGEMLNYKDINEIFDDEMGMDNHMIDINIEYLCEHLNITFKGDISISIDNFIKWMITAQATCRKNRENQSRHINLWLQNSCVQYNNGSPRCDECHRLDLDDDYCYIHCSDCQYDLCLNCIHRNFDDQDKDNKKEETIIKKMQIYTPVIASANINYDDKYNYIMPLILYSNEEDKIYGQKCINNRNIKNKIVVIKRGGKCDFTTKLINISKSGANGVIIINHNEKGHEKIPSLSIIKENVMETLLMKDDKNIIPIILIKDYNYGEQLLQQLKTNEKIYARIFVEYDFDKERKLSINHHNTHKNNNKHYLKDEFLKPLQFQATIHNIYDINTMEQRFSADISITTYVQANKKQIENLIFHKKYKEINKNNKDYNIIKEWKLDDPKIYFTNLIKNEEEYDEDEGDDDTQKCNFKHVKDDFSKDDNVENKENDNAGSDCESEDDDDDEEDIRKAENVDNDKIDPLQKDMRTYRVRNYHINGIFREKYELKSYPFDVQDLTFTLACKDNNYKFIPFINNNNQNAFLKMDREDLAIAEWRVLAIMTELMPGINNNNPSKLKIKVKLQRYYFAFLCKTVFPISVITLCTLYPYSFSADSHSDRLGYILTLLLTLVAFLFLVSTQVPNLPYLTLLDRYIIFGFIFISLVSFQFIFHHYFYEQNGNENDFLLLLHFLSDFLFWLLAHIFFAIRCYIISNDEINKVKMSTEEFTEEYENKEEKNALKICSLSQMNRNLYVCDIVKNETNIDHHDNNKACLSAVFKTLGLSKVVKSESFKTNNIKSMESQYNNNKDDDI